MDQEETPRRNFLNWLLGGASLAFLGAVFYPIGKYIVPPESGEASVNQVKLPFSRAEILASESRFKTFRFGRKLGIILADDSDNLRAMTATCTHLDCTVRYRPDWGIVWCACHNGRYDLDGRVISGPPPRPLETFEVTEVKDELFVSKVSA